MFSFSNNKSYLGINLGNGGVKVVELAAQGHRPRLVTYGYTETPVDLIKPLEPEQELEKAIIVLNKVVSESKTESRRVIAALPSFAVFSSIISLPNMSKDELAQAINWEAKKFVPLPIEDMVLDWRPLDEHKEGLGVFGRKKKEDLSGSTDSSLIKEISSSMKGGNPKQQKVLVTAAPKDLVDRYIRLFKASELELIALETEGFALERALIGRDPSMIMVVNMGSYSTDIAIIESGIPVLTRSVDVGGETITQAVAKSLNIDNHRAEQFKRDIGFISKEINSIPKVIETTINPIINEIKYSFDLYLGQHKQVSIEKIILTGGSSTLPGLVGYLKKILNINVFVGDPWARTIYPLELKPVLQEIGPRFAVSVGLAMREII